MTELTDSQVGISESPMSLEELHRIDAYWRAVLYLNLALIRRSSLQKRDPLDGSACEGLFLK